MLTAIVAAVAGVVIAGITVIGQWLSSRNDRTLTLQQLEILGKLDASSEAASDLRWVVDRRIASWRIRYSPARTVARRTRWACGYLILFATVLVVGSEFGRASELVFLAASAICAFLLIRVRLILNTELKVEKARAKRRDAQTAPPAVDNQSTQVSHPVRSVESQDFADGSVSRDIADT